MKYTEIEGYALHVVTTRYKGCLDDESLESNTQAKIVVFETVEDMEHYILEISESQDSHFRAEFKEWGFINGIKTYQEENTIDPYCEKVLTRYGFDVSLMLKEGFKIDMDKFNDALTLNENILDQGYAFCRTKTESDLNI